MCFGCNVLNDLVIGFGAEKQPFFLDKNFRSTMDPINIVGTEFYCKDNARENHTEEYDLIQLDPPTCVLRRGCSFYAAVNFDRPFDPTVDVVRLNFSIGPKPNIIRGTKTMVSINPNAKHLPKNPNRWGLRLDRVDGNIAVVQIQISCSASIGIWSCTIESNLIGRKEAPNEYRVPDDIYILFNPWCAHDSVYMENQEDLSEYILNETGKIWCGTFKKPSGKHWIFGQFDDIVLPAAVLLLERSGLAHSERGSPVMVARAISAIINASDDAGLLEGRWDGNYADGTSPFAWTGSAAIMDQYLRTGGAPVKYGQCWVFSAATVTVCRTLGIPCRSVTNYVSAHDTNMSMTVDKYFDIFGNKIENGPFGDCNDSCWNFHVWNDVWMSRPDLPPGYGGWQIIDATPQEQSDKVYRCGPASVTAVKKGEVGYLYDTPFVFSEVNADIVHFKEDEESDWGFSRMSINKYHVGRKILTKRCGPTDDQGDTDMWDVTPVYKNKEGTQAERLAVYSAIRGIPRAEQFYEIPNQGPEDVFFDLLDLDTVPFGDSFNVVVKIENRSNEERNITAFLSASSIYYNGATAKDIKKSQGSFMVQPGQSETLQIQVTPEEYIDKLVDHGLVKIYAIASVTETKQTWSEEDDFTLTPPDMVVLIAGMCKVGESCDVTFSFHNPLNIPLTECSYTVEGPGMHKPITVAYRDVDPKEMVNISESFTAKKAGERKTVVSFTSKQIQNINGSTVVTIEP